MVNIGERAYLMPFLEEVVVVRAASPTEIERDQMLYGLKGYLSYWVVRRVASGALCVANEIDLRPAWTVSERGDADGAR